MSDRRQEVTDLEVYSSGSPTDEETLFSRVRTGERPEVSLALHELRLYVE